MIAKAASALAAVLALSACAKSPPDNFFAGQRTVFDNPYIAPELASRGDGSGREGLIYPGAGRYAFDQDGNRVELTPAELRDFRERAEIIREHSEQAELLKGPGAPQVQLMPPPEQTATPR